VKAQISS